MVKKNTVVHTKKTSSDKEGHSNQNRKVRKSLHKNRLLMAIAVFWLVLIFGFIVVKEYTLQTGDEVLLKTMPVDPRDIFRGDFVVLSYEISTLNLDMLETDSADFQQGNTVYVALTPDTDGYGTPMGVFRERPSEGLFIKGSVRGVGPSTVLVTYGIEHYFVPEGEGLVLERARPGELDVLVAIDRRGNAGIKQLIRDGEIVRFT